MRSVPRLAPLLALLALASCGDDTPTDAADLLAPPDLLPSRPPLSFAAGRDFATQVVNARSGYPVVVPVADGDFDGDGIVDLALPNTDGVSLAVILGDGKGGFTPQPAMPTKGRPTSLVAGDFDGDGLDELLCGYDGNKLSLVHGRKNRIFDVPVDLDWPDNTYLLARGDFDGDGKLDAVTAPLSGTGLTLALGDGKGGFTAKAAYPFMGPSVLLGVGDFDGDKRDDVALSEVFQFLDLLRATGTALERTRQIDVPGATLDATAIGDFDGDGRKDLLLHASSTGPRTLLGKPDGSWADGPMLDLPGHADSVRTLDLDGDGALDVVVARDRANEVVVLLGDGRGAFTRAPVALPTSGPAMGLSVRDLDRDGRLDLVVAQGMGGLRVFLNTTPR